LKISNIKHVLVRVSETKSSNMRQSECCYKIRVLLTSALSTLFKDTQLRNYLLERLNILISDALNAQIYVKTYCLKSLKSVFWIPVSISHKIKKVLLISARGQALSNKKKRVMLTCVKRH